MGKNVNGYDERVEISTFNRNPVIRIPTDADGKYTFGFGLSKAKAILKFLPDIKKFVMENDSNYGKEETPEQPKPKPRIIRETSQYGEINNDDLNEFWEED